VTSLKNVLVEYSLHIGAFFYGVSLGGIMSIQGKYVGECAKEGPLGKYLMLNFGAISSATIFSFFLLEYVYHHATFIPLPKIFFCLILGVILIFVIVHYMSEENINKGMILFLFMFMLN
jgi:MFS family permease